MPSLRVLALATALFISSEAFASETIVFIRHGEKPEDGVGQLSCKGLQRSLKIPAILTAKFGTPDAIFAPDPTKQKPDKGVSYNYIRPLATIEPTAIMHSKTVNMPCGYDQIDCIASALDTKAYDGKLVVVAWEHHLIKNIVEKIAEARGAKVSVPSWQNDDFDSIYILKIDEKSAVFSSDKQGIAALKEDCSF